MLTSRKLFIKIGFDTAENEPLKVCQKLVKRQNKHQKQHRSRRTRGSGSRSVACPRGRGCGTGRRWVHPGPACRSSNNFEIRVRQQYDIKMLIIDSQHIKIATCSGILPLSQKRWNTFSAIFQLLSEHYRNIYSFRALFKCSRYDCARKSISFQENRCFYCKIESCTTL